MIKRLTIAIALGLVLMLTAPAAGAEDFADGHEIDLKLAGQTLNVVLALTRESQSLGLGGREFMPSGQGMLFVYATKRIRPFWMMGMKIPIDIIWLADDRVVGINRSVPPPLPGQAPVRIYPPKPVDMVLETAAGWSRAAGLTIGQRVTFLQGRPTPLTD